MTEAEKFNPIDENLGKRCDHWIFQQPIEGKICGCNFYRDNGSRGRKACGGFIDSECIRLLSADSVISSYMTKKTDENTIL